MIVEDEVIALLRENYVGEKEITPESSLGDDLGLDSLDAVEFMCDLEDRFGISIVDEEADKWTTVGDVISYISEKVVD